MVRWLGDALMWEAKWGGVCGQGQPLVGWRVSVTEAARVAANVVFKVRI